MRNFILFLLAIFTIGCNGTDDNVSEKKYFNLIKGSIKNINYREDFDWLFGDTLELFQQNKKCGEWGGDIERIRIFHKTKKIFGYYTKESFDCDNLEREYYGTPTSIMYQSEEIEFTNKQIALLKKAILDLTEHRLSNSLPIYNAGIDNRVQVLGEDEFSKELFIRDYPSFNWDKFHKLKNEILK